MTKSDMKMQASLARTSAAQRNDAPVATILQTKPHAPDLGATLALRQRLLNKPSRNPRRALTWVSAPVGCGKSMLAAQLLAAYKDPPVWLPLDLDGIDEGP